MSCDGDTAPLLRRLREAVASCRRDDGNSAGEVVSASASSCLVEAVLAILEDGLQGNRAVRRSPLAVLDGLATAYPLQLAPALEAARESAGVLGQHDERSVVRLWAQQALHSGTLPDTLKKLRNQPHVMGAYRKGALLRTPAAITQLSEILDPAKGLLFAEVQLIAETRAAMASSNTTTQSAVPTSQPSAPSLKLSSQPQQKALTHEDGVDKGGRHLNKARTHSGAWQEHPWMKGLAQQGRAVQSAAVGFIADRLSERRLGADIGGVVARTDDQALCVVQLRVDKSGHVAISLNCGDRNIHSTQGTSAVRAPRTEPSRHGSGPLQAVASVAENVVKSFDQSGHRTAAAPQSSRHPSSWVAGLLQRMGSGEGDRPVLSSAEPSSSPSPPCSIRLEVSSSGRVTVQIAVQSQPTPTTTTKTSKTAMKIPMSMTSTEGSGEKVMGGRIDATCDVEGYAGRTSGDGHVSGLHESGSKVACQLVSAVASIAVDLPSSSSSASASTISCSDPHVTSLLDAVSELFAHGLRPRARRARPVALMQEHRRGIGNSNITAAIWEFLLSVEAGWEKSGGLPLECVKIQAAARAAPRAFPPTRCLRLWLMHCLEQQLLYTHITAISELPRVALLGWYERDALLLQPDALCPALAALAGTARMAFSAGEMLTDVRDHLAAGTRVDVGLPDHPLQGALNAVGGVVGGLFNRPRYGGQTWQTAAVGREARSTGRDSSDHTSSTRSAHVLPTDINDAKLEAAGTAQQKTSIQKSRVVDIGDSTSPHSALQPTAAAPMKSPFLMSAPENDDLEDMLRLLDCSSPCQPSSPPVASEETPSTANASCEMGEPLPTFLPILPLPSRSEGGGKDLSEHQLLSHQLGFRSWGAGEEEEVSSGADWDARGGSFGALFGAALRVDSDWLSMGRVTEASEAHWLQPLECLISDGDEQTPLAGERGHSAEMLRSASPYSTATHDRPYDHPKSATPRVPSTVAVGDFSELLSEDNTDIASAAGIDATQPLPESSSEVIDTAEDPTGASVVAELVAAAFAKAIRVAEGGETEAKATSEESPTEAGMGVQAMIWVDSEDRAQLSLFIPRISYRRLPTSLSAAHTPNVSVQEDDLPSSRSSSSMASSSSRSSTISPSSRNNNKGITKISDECEEDKSEACVLELSTPNVPQKGTRAAFPGVPELPRTTSATRTQGFVMGVQLMEGYAGSAGEERRTEDANTSQFIDSAEPRRAAWEPKWASVAGAEIRQPDGEEAHTVYRVEVLSRDDRRWTVEHRFREFTALRHALKHNHLPLPPCWDDISRARSVTGRHKLAPEVVEARRLMLDRCLDEALAGPSELSVAEPLLDFLAPPGGYAFVDGANATGTAASSGAAGHSQATAHQWSPVPWISMRSTSSANEAADEAAASQSQVEASTSTSTSNVGNGEPPCGGSVRLNLHLPPPASEAHLLQRQQGQCAGCHAPLQPTARRPSILLSSLGLASAAPAGPRRCEYTGHLYCSRCCGTATAVIPARVLHEWDFKRYHVSNLAAEYLSSIYEQPMLCVAAVNPGLSARVALLARVHDTRVRACKALRLARAQGGAGAASAERLLKAAGPRRYLLEAHEFWAMRELVELSKGAYSRLPSWLETVSERASTLAISFIVRTGTNAQE